MFQYRFAIGILLIISHTAFSQSSSWKCTIYDVDRKVWSSSSGHHTLAIHSVFDSCLKESRLPQSCQKKTITCEGYDQIQKDGQGWVCTAFDRLAKAWPSRSSSNVDAAALRAKQACRSKSRVPETCYINFVTCRLN
ncbi:MAG: hypothetical protein H0U75_05030 [Legionella sp.]|nr:hypothetical protein [Legionella sp.]